MRAIQKYISDNNLYVPEDKRYILLDSNSDTLHSLNIMKIEFYEEKELRIQKFRTYRENIIFCHSIK